MLNFKTHFVLNEGGVAGHMSHIYENINLTATQLKELFKDVSCDPKRRTSYLIQEFIGLGDIFDLKNAEPGSFSCLGQSVQFQRSLHRHVAGQVGKLYFDQLFGIQ